MLDLLLKGGVVIDPAQNIHEIRDVALKQGKVALVKEEISSDEAKKTLDLSEKIVVPGLIDFHTHVYYGGNQWGVNPQSHDLNPGVTLLNDAGSSGAGNFLGFKEHIIDRCSRRITVFLHIAYTGLSGGIYQPEDLVLLGELFDIRYAMVTAAIETGKRYPDIIKGIKVRASVEATGENGIAAINLALKAADELDKPLMVHIGMPPPVIEEILPLLREGDILTHAFRGKPNSPIKDNEIFSCMYEARERGVLFDIGHGQGSFSFKTANGMLANGFSPDIISSDIHYKSIKGPAYDLLTTMSKMLSIGMELEEVIKSTTWTPAKALGIEDKFGSLKEGAISDISVLEISKGKFQFSDCFGHTIVAEQRIIPLYTILGGKLIKHENYT